MCPPIRTRPIPYIYNTEHEQRLRQQWERQAYRALRSQSPLGTPFLTAAQRCTMAYVGTVVVLAELSRMLFPEENRLDECSLTPSVSNAIRNSVPNRCALIRCSELRSNHRVAEVRRDQRFRLPDVHEVLVKARRVSSRLSNTRRYVFWDTEYSVRHENSIIKTINDCNNNWE